MEKKLKFNAFLKGVSIFAFVAFCLLAILAGVTLPFASRVITADNVAYCSESDLAVASADDTFNPLLYSIPLSQCNTTDTYYGFYFPLDLINSLSSVSFNDEYICAFYSYNYYLRFTNNNSFPKTATILFNSEPIYFIPFNSSVYSICSPYFILNSGFTFSEFASGSFFDSVKDKLYVFNTFPYGYHETIVTNNGFESRFGNFVGLASSDFYINLDVAPVIPSQLCQVLVPGSDTVNDKWYLKAQSLDLNIYYLPLFDKYYLNGSIWIGNVNCGWVLDYFYGKKVPQLRFRVFGTDIWKADCDFTRDTGLISNVRNGQFLVSSNYISNFNVYKISSADDSLYIMRDVYNDVAYSSFLDSFIAQQDFKNVKIPSDNALYLKGYQSASDEYFNNGYNTGFSDGEKSGYNTGFSAGDSAGYSRGLEDSNNYSFLSLFGAVFDAPIQALFGGTQRLPAGTKITDTNGNTITLQTATTVNRGGLLNFELMGVNLSGFVLALFSLSILIVVIKFALGKR